MEDIGRRIGVIGRAHRWRKRVRQREAALLDEMAVRHVEPMRADRRQDRVRDFLNVESCRIRQRRQRGPRRLQREIECLLAGDGSDRSVGLGRQLFVFRSPIHAEINRPDALGHARLIAADGIIAVGVEEHLHHQLLAGDDDAIGGARHAAFGSDGPARDGFGMGVGEMIEHHAPHAADAVGLRPRDAAQPVNETGFLSLWRHCSLLKNVRAVVSARNAGGG